MKFEENFKQICWMPICSFLGIIIGIVAANFLNGNIGIGISLGWSHGFFVGAVISLILSKLPFIKKVKILSSVIALTGLAIFPFFTKSLVFKIIGYCGFIIFGIFLIIVSNRKD